MSGVPHSTWSPSGRPLHPSLLEFVKELAGHRRRRAALRDRQLTGERRLNPSIPEELEHTIRFGRLGFAAPPIRPALSGRKLYERERRFYYLGQY